jgi:hypothetical protein
LTFNPEGFILGREWKKVGQMIEQMNQVGALLGPGVYALLYRRQVVYVGQSVLLLTRLYQHRNNYLRFRKGQTVAGTPGKAILFDDIRIWPCPRQDLDRIEKLLIQNYNPKCNTRGVPKTKEVLELKIGGISIRLNDIVASRATSGEAFVRRI